MEFGYDNLDAFLFYLYNDSIKNKNYSERDLKRLERFINHIRNYYDDMIKNGYINKENCDYYLAKIMCLNLIEIDLNKVNSANALAYYSYEKKLCSIVTANFDNDYHDPSRGMYIVSSDFERLVDYHELSHVLMRGLNSRASECVSRYRTLDSLDSNETKKLREKIGLALRCMNEYTAEYISNELVVPGYKNRDTLITGDSHFFGKPYESHLVHYNMLEPLCDASSKLLFKDSDKYMRRRLFSEMMLKYDPTKEIEKLVGREEEFAIYDAFETMMNSLNSTNNKFWNSWEENKTLKRLKRMK